MAGEWNELVECLDEFRRVCELVLTQKFRISKLLSQDVYSASALGPRPLLRKPRSIAKLVLITHNESRSIETSCAAPVEPGVNNFVGIDYRFVEKIRVFDRPVRSPYFANTPRLWTPWLPWHLTR